LTLHKNGGLIFEPSAALKLLGLRFYEDIQDLSSVKNRTGTWSV